VASALLRYQLIHLQSFITKNNSFHFIFALKNIEISFCFISSTCANNFKRKESDRIQGKTIGDI
jgi:hypothetical protein